MMNLDSELNQSGDCLASEALADPSQAKTVRVTGGAPVPTGGPFAEVKESLAVYWILDVDEGRALQIASQLAAYSHKGRRDVPALRRTSSRQMRRVEWPALFG